MRQIEEAREMLLKAALEFAENDCDRNAAMLRVRARRYSRAVKNTPHVQSAGEWS